MSLAPIKPSELYVCPASYSNKAGTSPPLLASTAKVYVSPLFKFTTISLSWLKALEPKAPSSTSTRSTFSSMLLIVRIVPASVPITLIKETKVSGAVEG